MNKNKIILLVTIITVIIIILCICILSIIKKEERLGSDKYVTEYEQTDVYKSELQLKKIDNKNKYLVIEEIFSTYLTYIQSINKDITVYTPEEALGALIQMLDKQYVKEMNITQEKLKKYAEQYKGKIDYYIDDIYIYDKTSNIDIFIVYACIKDIKIKFIVKTDSINDTYTIFLEDYINTVSIEKVPEKISSEEIQKNSYNQFTYINATDNIMANEYIKRIAYLLTNETEKMYQLLDENYKQKRFPTLENFTNYIQTSQKDFEGIMVEECSVDAKDDYTKYTIKDQYGNYFVIKETGVMDYTIMLDDYTLESKEFIERYQKADRPNKGVLNIDKFFKMINMQDYASAYKLLDENFKQNYFKTQNDFENYIKAKVYKFNKVDYKYYNNQTMDIYTYNVKLTDYTNTEAPEIDFNIVMKFLEGTNFVMSFTVQ